MAGFATLPLWAFFAVHRSREVRRSFVILDEVLVGHIGVAGLAGLFPDVLRSVNRGSGGTLRWLVLRIRHRGLCAGRARRNEKKQRNSGQ